NREERVLAERNREILGPDDVLKAAVVVAHRHRQSLHQLVLDGHVPDALKRPPDSGGGILVPAHAERDVSRRTDLLFLSDIVAIAVDPRPLIHRKHRWTIHGRVNRTT